MGAAAQAARAERPAVRSTRRRRRRDARSAARSPTRTSPRGRRQLRRGAAVDPEDHLPRAQRQRRAPRGMARGRCARREIVEQGGAARADQARQVAPRARAAVDDTALRSSAPSRCATCSRASSAATSAAAIRRSSRRACRSRPTKDSEAAVREIAQRLRDSLCRRLRGARGPRRGGAGLRERQLPPDALGAIDTFRFEERALLRHADDLIATASSTRRSSSSTSGSTASGLTGTSAGRPSGRPAAAWPSSGDVAMEVADSGRQGPRTTPPPGSTPTRRRTAGTVSTRRSVASRPGSRTSTRSPRSARSASSGAPTRTPATRWPTASPRRSRRLAGPFPESLHQTHIYTRSSPTRPKPVAYFLVDAMRFEMGVELAERLAGDRRGLDPRRPSRALPSITPIGMAALMPGRLGELLASSSRAASSARGSTTPSCPTSRRARSLAAARCPKLVDLALDELLSLQPSKLAKKIDGAQVVVVRSQEIDHAGETGFTFQARQVMDTVIDNLARAIRKLAAAGIEHAVVTADHGHLFFADRPRRVDADRRPGGEHGRAAPALLDRPRRRDAAGLRPRLRGGARLRLGPRLRVPDRRRGLQGRRRSRLPPRRAVAAGAGRSRCSPCASTAREPARRRRAPVAVTGRARRGHQPHLQRDARARRQHLLFATEPSVRPLLIVGGQAGRRGRHGDRRRARPRDRQRDARSPAKPVTVAFLLSDESVRVAARSSCRTRRPTRSCTARPTTSPFDLECEPMSNATQPPRATRSTTR